MLDVRLISDFADVSVERLLEAIAFEQRSVTVFGKTYPQPRLTKWYGSVEYRYSSLTWAPAPMPPLLTELAERVAAECGVELDSVLANLYRDGGDSMGWHADDEPLFDPTAPIASLSFGATRTFRFRRRDDHSRTESFELPHGSLLIMGAGVQEQWHHCVPRRKRVTQPRVNLTYRKIRDRTGASHADERG